LRRIAIEQCGLQVPKVAHRYWKGSGNFAFSAPQPSWGPSDSRYRYDSFEVSELLESKLCVAGDLPLLQHVPTYLQETQVLLHKFSTQVSNREGQTAFQGALACFSSSPRQSLPWSMWCSFFAHTFTMVGRQGSDILGMVGADSST
jgi:hypothetical protein